MEILCKKCRVENDSQDWVVKTAIAVTGTTDLSTAGDISDPEVRGDLNYFWVCPNCDRQVRGNEVAVLEDIEPVGTDQVTVTLAINLDVDPGESRESILERVRTYLEELESGRSLESIFDDIAVSGIDF